jgi:pSer/pThr/pTyr-binding forkhead associated (FHA) protein
VETPYLSIEETGEVFPLALEVTTVGRGDGIDVQLGDPTVSRLHAELVRRGPYVYVSDLGLSSNGTRVNGRPVGRRLLADGDVVAFGASRCRVGGLFSMESDEPATELQRANAPDLTRRESEVLIALCRPALSQEAFVAPATAREIADELVVTEAAVKQHLLRLYSKFHIPEGIGRRARLANEVISVGVVRPLPEPKDGTAHRAAAS